MLISTIISIHEYHCYSRTNISIRKTFGFYMTLTFKYGYFRYLVLETHIVLNVKNQILLTELNKAIKSPILQSTKSTLNAEKRNM